MTEGRSELLHAEGPPPGLAQAALAGSATRSLFYLVSALDPDTRYPSAMIGNRLNELQGIHPAWRVDDHELNVTLRHYDYTLVPLHMATRTTIPSEQSRPPVKAYRANEENLEQNIAYAGDTLDWEIQHPSFKRAELLGEVIRIHSACPRPVVAMEVYSAIVNSPSGASASTTMTTERLTLSAIDKSLRFSTEQGVVIKRSKSNLYDRQLELSSLDLRLKSLHNKLNPASRAIRDTMLSLCNAGYTTIDGETLVDKVLSTYPHLEKSSVRKALTKPPSFVNFTDEAVYGGKLTRYEIAPHAQTAIADLVLRHKLLQTNEGYIKAAARRARQIMNNSSLVTFLMGKSMPDGLGRPQGKLWQLDECEAIEQRLASLTLKDSEVPQLREQLNIAEDRHQATMAAYAALPRRIASYRRSQGIV